MLVLYILSRISFLFPSLRRCFALRYQYHTDSNNFSASQSRIALLLIHYILLFYFVILKIEDMSGFSLFVYR
jgi:hypothetical protein